MIQIFISVVKKSKFSTLLSFLFILFNKKASMKLFFRPCLLKFCQDQIFINSQKYMENLELCDIYGLSSIHKGKIKSSIIQGLSQNTQYLANDFKSSMNPKFMYISASLGANQLKIYCKEFSKTIKLQFWSQVHYITKSDNTICGMKIKISEKQSVQLYHDSPQVIDLWRRKMSKYVILWGFYEDFKPLLKIGQGKNASVFLAKRRIDGQKFAVKAFLKKDFRSDPRSLASLKNQMEILRAIDHPNITKQISLYETQKSYYLIMQYIDGKSLKQYLQKKTFAFKDSLSMLRKILKGLKYLQKNNIAHRDIKPQNIMIRSHNQEPVIVDFGLAINCSSSDYIYNHCGTPGYVAPQIFQAKEDLKLSPKVDVFSLGVVFHIFLFRRFPYGGKDYTTILQSNKKANFNFNSVQYFHLPEFGKQLLRIMLEKDPNNRPSARNIMKKLESFDEKKSKREKQHISRTSTEESNSRLSQNSLQKNSDSRKFQKLKSLDSYLRKSVHHYIQNYRQI